VLRALLRGLLKAAALLGLVVIGLQLAGALTWPLQTSATVVLNGLALALGVGFAEELLFRGWLLGELELQWGRQRALLLQAALFSLVHTRFNLPLLPLLRRRREPHEQQHVLHLLLRLLRLLRFFGFLDFLGVRFFGFFGFLRFRFFGFLRFLRFRFFDFLGFD
jgi:hypothetical protein